MASKKLTDKQIEKVKEIINKASKEFEDASVIITVTENALSAPALRKGIKAAEKLSEKLRKALSIVAPPGEV